MENPINPQPTDNQNYTGVATATAQPVNQAPFVDPYAAAMRGEIIVQERQLQNGAKWFNTIAVLSMINSVLSLAGLNLSFLAGLGVTGLITEVATLSKGDFATVITIVALVLNLIAAGIFFLLATYAKKRQGWAFIVGMIAYGLDTLLCVLLAFLAPTLFLSVAFHCYALFNIFKGFRASQELNRLEPAVRSSF